MNKLDNNKVLTRKVYVAPESLEIFANLTGSVLAGSNVGAKAEKGVWNGLDTNNAKSASSWSDDSEAEKTEAGNGSAKSGIWN